MLLHHKRSSHAPIPAAPAVSTLVHAQLGGVVEHRGFDSTDLSDGQKLLQRLYALNIMKLEGRLRDTDLELWQVGAGPT